MNEDSQEYYNVTRRVEQSLCPDHKFLTHKAVHKKMQEFMGQHNLGSANGHKDIRDYAFVHMMTMANHKTSWNPDQDDFKLDWGSLQMGRFADMYRGGEGTKELAYKEISDTRAFKVAIAEVKFVQKKQGGCWLWDTGAHQIPNPKID